MDPAQMASNKKKARKLHATIVFADESGFSLVPFVAKTWAIRGQTPIVRHAFRWPKISAISALTTRNQLLFMVVDGSIGGAECQRFLIHLVRHVKGPIILIWDNNRPHKSDDVKEVVISSHGNLMLEFLPPYAPEINPDEGLWSYLKTHELANKCVKDTKELSQEVRRAVSRTRHRSGLVHGMLRGTPLCMDGLLTQ
jgi:putative transposase